MAVGSHSITANYGGAPGFLASTSNAIAHVVAAPLTPPSIVSVVVNGNIAALAGTQRSRIASVVTVFDQAVQVDPNAFTLSLHTQSVSYNDVDMPNGYGALPASLIVTPSADRKTWIVTFAGNTDDGAAGWLQLAQRRRL